MRVISVCLACVCFTSCCFGFQGGFGPKSGSDEEPIEEWGKFVDPDENCLIQTDEDSLEIVFGQGSFVLDAEKDAMNSPRVVEKVSGDFAVQVTVDGNLPLPELVGRSTRAYISGGLLVMDDEKNYVRFERASFTRSGSIWHYANFEKRENGKRTRMGLFADFPLKEDKKVDLRLEVKDDRMRAFVRHEGDEWHELGTCKTSKGTEKLVGVMGVKTANERASVRFRGRQLQSDFQQVKATTKSKIDLDKRPEPAFPFGFEF